MSPEPIETTWMPCALLFRLILFVIFPGHLQQSLQQFQQADPHLGGSQPITSTGSPSTSVTLVPFGGLPITFTKFCMVPDANISIWANNLIYSDFPGSSWGRIQLIFWASLIPSGVLSTKFKPLGRASLTKTGLRGWSPVLVTLMINLTMVCGYPLDGETLFSIEIFGSHRITSTVSLP